MYPVITVDVANLNSVIFSNNFSLMLIQFTLIAVLRISSIMNQIHFQQCHLFSSIQFNVDSIDFKSIS